MKKRKAAAAVAVTAAAVAGMVTGAAFDSPADLVPEAVAAQQQADDDAAAPETRRGPMAKVRAWVMSWPAAVRMLVAVPLWCVGWVLLSALSVFWAGASPVLSGFLNWVCLAALLLGVFAVSAKAAFPGVPFRRLLRAGNILLLVLLSAVLWVADLALPTVWTGYDLISRTVWRVGAACLLAFVCCKELGHQGRRAVRNRQPEPLPRRTAVEEEAMRLADTVCPPR